MNIRSNMSNAVNALQTGGPLGVLSFVHRRLTDRILEPRRYQKWIVKNALTDRRRAEMKQLANEFNIQPVISVILPVFNVDEKWLRLCIESVMSQIYSNWELCIADDCSTLSHIRPTLRAYAKRDKRVKLCFRETNGHISAASNSALELATGEFVVLLDHDDELSKDALFWVAKEINEHPDAAMIYSDEDKIDERGRRSQPAFKPDWSPDLFNSLNLVTHLSVYKTELVRSIGGFRSGFEGSQDYDLALRITENIPAENIRHIPRILYHWRTIEGSVALSGDEKPYAHERAREAIREHLARARTYATVDASFYNLHRVRYVLPDPIPSVSLFVIGSGGIANNLSVSYQNYEIYRIPSGQSAKELNELASGSTGEIICFLDSNMLPVGDSWLAELVSFANQAGTGAVGGKVLDRNMRVCDGALVIGTADLIDVSHKGMSVDAPGNMFRNQMISNFSAISITSMTLRREVFKEVKGFDQENLPYALFDADLCLRLREKGYRIVFDPYVEFIREKPSKRRVPSRNEAEYFHRRWPSYFDKDPFYNTNLSRKDGSFSIKV